jgi:hypothetical protein
MDKPKDLEVSLKQSLLGSWCRTHGGHFWVTGKRWRRKGLLFRREEVVQCIYCFNYLLRAKEDK